MSERKIETEQGIITVNKPELKVGEEVRIAVEPNRKNIQSMKGILQLQKMGSNMRKKECYLLSMMKKRRAGLLTIKQGIFDLQGDWNLQLVQSYKENEKEELIKMK